MRTPTPPAVSLSWHRAAISGERVQTTTEPQCGYYLVSGQGYRAPQVPAVIYLEQQTDPETGELIADEVLRAEIAGKPQESVEEAWLYMAKRPICRLEYLRRIEAAMA